MFNDLISCRRGAPQRAVQAAIVAACLAMLTACGGGGSSSASAGGDSASTEQLSPAATLGKQAFEDVTLSASGQQSCESCHQPAKAYSDGLVVHLGGPNLDLPGLRNAPSLTYASFSPAFHQLADGSPIGGFFRDGRARTLAEQASEPFLNPFEMANADAARVIAILQTRPYFQQFVNVYGSAVLGTPDTALADLASAIAAYETEDESFHPFDSKFDAYLAGKTQLTAREQQGFGLFNNPSAGNCAACHPSQSADGVTPALFTDFSYDNLGVPRNALIPANDDATSLPYVPANGTDGIHRYYDEGVCGPIGQALQNNVSGFCGQFKVPSLRNVALTAPYFHNGEFADLKSALSFYVTRDTTPSAWYPTDADGNATKFDDLDALYGGNFVLNVLVPGGDATYLGNVNTSEIPYNRKLGGSASLSPDEIDAVIAFLCTLTDGFDPAHPDQYALPAQCAPSATAD